MHNRDSAIDSFPIILATTDSDGSDADGEWTDVVHLGDEKQTLPVTLEGDNDIHDGTGDALDVICGGSEIDLIGQEESDGYVTDSEDNDIHENDGTVAEAVDVSRREEGVGCEEMDVASLRSEGSRWTRTSRSTGLTKSQVKFKGMRGGELGGGGRTYSLIL